MTSASIGMLVDEGKLKWDDKVTKILPGFQLADPYATRELTVRDLLTPSRRPRKRGRAVVSLGQLRGRGDPSRALR
jgi:hypothetical protein